MQFVCSGILLGKKELTRKDKKGTFVIATLAQGSETLDAFVSDEALKELSMVDEYQQVDFDLDITNRNGKQFISLLSIQKAE